MVAKKAVISFFNRGKGISLKTNNDKFESMNFMHCLLEVDSTKIIFERRGAPSGLWIPLALLGLEHKDLQ